MTHLVYKAMKLVNELFPGRTGKQNKKAHYAAIDKVASALRTDLFGLGVISEPTGLVFGNVTITYANGRKTEIRGVGRDGEEFWARGRHLQSRAS